MKPTLSAAGLSILFREETIGLHIYNTPPNQYSLYFLPHFLNLGLLIGRFKGNEDTKMCMFVLNVGRKS